MSFRKVDWRSLTTNFFMVLSPGALDGAPTIYLATARVPADLETRLQDRVVAAFPNVTAIPLRGVLERVSEVLAFDFRSGRRSPRTVWSIPVGLALAASPLSGIRQWGDYPTCPTASAGFNT